jgi:hypothetical protein
MLVPKSCIFFTDLLNLRLSELLREGSSEDVLADTVDDDALGAALTCDRKLGELADECPMGRISCRLRERWLRQKANLDSSVGKCGLRRSLDACSWGRKSDQLMLGRWVLLLGQAWPAADEDKSAAVSSRDSDVLREIALAKSMPCMYLSCSSWVWLELNGTVEECTV